MLLELQDLQGDLAALLRRLGHAMLDRQIVDAQLQVLLGGGQLLARNVLLTFPDPGSARDGRRDGLGQLARLGVVSVYLTRIDLRLQVGGELGGLKRLPAVQGLELDPVALFGGRRGGRLGARNVVLVAKQTLADLEISLRNLFGSLTV